MYPWLTKVYQQLSRRAKEQQLHHGLLIKGPAGLGKKTFSHQLARVLLCKAPAEMACGKCQSCLLFSSGAHPDFHQIEAEKQIGVDQVRAAIQKLSGTSQLSGNKVLVIADAHNMTESSANALLKTLEEPTQHTFLILVSDQSERLLPTIVSRCEKVSLQAPSITDCQQWLTEHGHQDVDADFILMYNQAPLIIKQELEISEGLNYQQFLQSLYELNNGQADAVVLAEKFAENAHKVVPWLKHHVRLTIVNSLQNDALWQFYQDCMEAEIALLNPGINRIVLLSKLLSQAPLLNQSQPPKLA